MRPRVHSTKVTIPQRLDPSVLKAEVVVARGVLRHGRVLLLD